MLTTSVKESFLPLIRQGIGHSADALAQNYDWKSIETLSAEHGLSAIMVDGVELLPDDKRPPKDVLLQWIGETLQNYEYRYDAYQKTISEMASFYNQHGFKMMVLKGYGCSLNWPKPNHRPVGDIDIWLFGKQKEADECLLKEKGIKVDTSEHHHTVFYWREFMVENHYDFLNIHQHKSSVVMEKIFKELGTDDSHSVDVDGEKVYLPSPNLHALFLLKHSMVHFAAEGINLRQLLDWAFFVEKHSSEIDWDWLEGVLEQYGMKKLYDIYNAICVGDLGFDVSLFRKGRFTHDLKDRVLNEILFPKYPPNDLPKSFVRRVFFKYKRWRDNEWKHELCYKENMWSSFWSGVWMHLLKPSQI